MIGQMDNINEWMDGWMVELMDGCIKKGIGRKDEWRDGWMDKKMNGRMEG